jgi:hypothetical protein
MSDAPYCTGCERLLEANRTLSCERDTARAEVERLKAALIGMGHGDGDKWCGCPDDWEYGDDHSEHCERARAALAAAPAERTEGR